MQPFQISCRQHRHIYKTHLFHNRLNLHTPNSLSYLNEKGGRSRLPGHSPPHGCPQNRLKNQLARTTNVLWSICLCQVCDFTALRHMSVASLAVPGGQEFHFLHFFSNFHHCFLFLLKLSSFWPFGWAHPGRAWLRNCLDNTFVHIYLQPVYTCACVPQHSFTNPLVC